MTARELLSIRQARRDDVGSLLTHLALYVVPGEMIDPFLLLAHHGPQTFPPNNRGLPFGPHPHRGFETVTFILDGELMHRDSGGHESVIAGGGVQWMTAGSGVIHSETSPKGFLASGGSVEILQLWLNLPGRLKMTAPQYTGLQEAEIPEIALSSGSGMRLVSGEMADVTGPIKSLTNTFLSVVRLREGAQEDLPAPAGRAVLFYVARGAVRIDGVDLPPGSVALFGDDGDGIRVSASDEAVILYGHADPTGEPVAVGGPFVMNTQAELEQAYRDLRTGRLDAIPSGA